MVSVRTLVTIGALVTGLGLHAFAAPGDPSDVSAQRRQAKSSTNLQDVVSKIRLPQGFAIEVYAKDLPTARQMAWGEKGTLFVGSFGAGNVYAVTGQGAEQKTTIIAKGLNVPTGIAVIGRDLYVAAQDRLLKFENIEDRLDAPGDGKLVYSMPKHASHGWKYLAADKDGWLYIPIGAPFNIGKPAEGFAQIRRVNPANGQAEVVAEGVRNSVGGDIDPRSGRYWFTDNGRDHMGDDVPADELNMITRSGQHFGYPYCHQGDVPDPEFRKGRKCSDYVAPVVMLGAHVAALGMKFYTGTQFPEGYRNNIFIAEHGSWNREVYQGARITRVETDADGKTAKASVFAEGWLQKDNEYIGRPADVLQAPDGALLVSDDWSGTIYRISYTK